MRILKYMLECMTDDQKVSVIGHLWTDILNVVGEKYFIDKENDYEVIRVRRNFIKDFEERKIDFFFFQDTLTCLTCDEMKLLCLKNRPEEESEQGEGVGPVEDTKRKSQIIQVF